MAVSLMVTALLFGLPIIQFQTYNQDGVIKGTAGIAYEKAQYADISVPLTNDYIAETIREVQALFENPDNVGYDGHEQFLIEMHTGTALHPGKVCAICLQEITQIPMKALAIMRWLTWTFRMGWTFIRQGRKKSKRY